MTSPWNVTSKWDLAPWYATFKWDLSLWYASFKWCCISFEMSLSSEIASPWYFTSETYLPLSAPNDIISHLKCYFQVRLYLCKMSVATDIMNLPDIDFQVRLISWICHIHIYLKYQIHVRYCISLMSLPSEIYL